MRKTPAFTLSLSAAFVALGSWGCARQAPVTPATRADAHAQTNAAPTPVWPGWEAVPDPGADPEQLECSMQGTGPIARLTRTPNQRVVAEVSTTRAVTREALPFDDIIGLPPDALGARQVLAVKGGALVALDAGEFGAGLFFVASSTHRAARLDRSDEPIRRIVALSFGIVGVSGLCHGDACPSKSGLFRIEPSSRGSWRIEPLQRLDGCPATVSVEPGNEALLVGSCDALRRISNSTVTLIAQWPSPLIPSAVEAAEENHTVAYYATFGRLVARFTEHEPATWFAPSACPRLVRRADGGCACATPSAEP